MVGPIQQLARSAMTADVIAAAVARAVRAAIIYLPPRRRGMRVADLTESLFGKPNRRLRARHMSGYVVTCDLRDAVQRSLFYRGTYEPVTSTLIKATLVPGDTFLDVGANAGHYTFLAAQEVGATGCVYAIEASRSTAQTLVEDVRWNVLTDRVWVHNVAAFDHSSRLSVYVPDGPSPIGMRSIHESPNSRAAEEVDAMPLDELLPDARPSVIKIDVEGADARALTGMRSMIERSRPRLIVVEAEDEQLRRFGDSTQELIAYMHKLDYSWEAVDEPFHPKSLAFVPSQQASKRLP
jgi:FkbM family methyltransferase